MPEETLSFAFVLYGSPPTLDTHAIACAHAELNPKAPALLASPAQLGDETNTATLSFVDGKGEIILGTIAAAIPTGEAEAATEFSVSRFSEAGAQPPNKHGAHAIVSLAPWPDSKPLEELMRLSWAIAAIAKATGGLAVYWGNGCVTHPADFFIEGARESDGEITLPHLWLGVSFAQEKSGVSFLTFGVQQQFALPELKVWAPKGDEQDALAYTLNLASYVIDRGVPIPAGETVGRTKDERLAVRYEASPIGRSEQVMCVDLPGKRGWWSFRR